MGCSTLHIKTEIECRVFLFDEEKGVAIPGTYFNLEVRKGEQDLLFVSTEDETVRYQMLYNVEENDCDYRILLGKTQFKISIENLVSLANQGNAIAQCKLGHCYEYEIGVEHNDQKAIEWYTMSAEQGDSKAQCNLGRYYEYGLGVDINYQKAAEWYTKSAEQGDAEAQYKLGDCYYGGLGVEQNYQKAVDLFTKAAEQGYDKAQYVIGCLYLNGRGGVEKNYQKAVEWLTKSAEQGYDYAQYHLGRCYEFGKGVEQDYQKATKWYQKASELSCLAEAKDSLKRVKKESETINNRNGNDNTNPPYYLFFDTETTGVPMDYDLPARFTRNWPRLVQLAWIVTDEDGNTLKEGNEIIRPEGFDIPEDAVSVHGITTEKAMQDGKPLQDVIRDFLHDAEQAQCLVGHNISYDQRVVSAELYRLGLTDILSDKECICTMKSTTNFCKIPGYYGYKYPKLQELYRKLFDSDFEDAHDAMADITATMKCFFELLRIGKINEDPDASIDDDEQESNNEDHYGNEPLEPDDLPF